MRVAAPLVLRSGDGRRLTVMVRSQTVTSAAALRGRIVLLAADGVPNAEIARRAGVSRPTVVGWGQRYTDAGMKGLSDLHRPGRPAVIDDADVVVATLTAPPESLGVRTGRPGCWLLSWGSRSRRWPGSGESGTRSHGGWRRSSSLPTRS